MTFGSRNQRKRNREEKSAKEAEKQRARDEEIKRKKADDELEAQKQQFIAQNRTLPDEARLKEPARP